MTTKMKMILAGACLALAGCGGGGGGAPAAGPAVLAPVELVQLGLAFDVPVNVLSADVQANTVSVADDEATVELTDLTFNADGTVDTFSLTITLPDGNQVTLDNTTVSTNNDIEDVTDIGFKSDVNMDLYTATLTTTGDDVVEVFIGLGINTAITDPNVDSTEDAAFADDTLYVLARVNLDEADPADDLGFNTYLVTGIATDGLPTGFADYIGSAISSVYQDGALLDDDVTGNARIEAFFDTNLVDVKFSGFGNFIDANGNFRAIEVQLVGNDIPIDGSGFSGALGFIGDQDKGPSQSFVEIANDQIFVDGTVLGTFFGEFAEGTAGVFGATETAQEAAFGADVEVVGGFVAGARAGRTD